ncbi:MAG: outer membrane beta-barrel protein [Bacteroidia bacterium]|nr:outer membrane beta-barrel protein [Bacteroidia bacterium]
MKVFITISLLVLFLPVINLAQPAGPPLRLGFGFSGSSYLGDLVENEPRVRRSYPGMNLSLQFDRQKRLQMQMNAGFGRFTEQNDLIIRQPLSEVVPNDFVETSFFYTDLRLLVKFLHKTPVQPFAGLGAGLLFFNPRDASGNFLGENIFTRLDNENYSTIIAGFPATAGVEARLSPMLGIALEYTHRFTMSDYLDNIGKLGTRKGNDAVQTFQVSVLISLNQKPAPEPLPRQEKKPEEIPLLTLTPITIPPADPQLLHIPKTLPRISPPDMEVYEQLQNFIHTDLIIIRDSLQVLPPSLPLQNSVGANQKQP